MKIVVSGASGLIGPALVAELRDHGHEVLRLVRRAPATPDEVGWDPAAGEIDSTALGRVDGAVNLSGAGPGDHRWTEEYQRTILSSRVDATTTLARALAAMDPRPEVLVNASGEGVYGSDRGEELLTEESALGDGFLADVVRAWEAATVPAQDAGIRVAFARTGLVMSRRGGSIKRMLPIYRCGIGGPLGSGRQWWSSISLPDQVAAMRHLLETGTASGPYHLAAPEQARNRQFNAALGRALRRPCMLPVPAFALKIVLDGFAGEVLGSLRISPQKLVDSGFVHQHPTTDDIVAAALRD